MSAQPTTVAASVKWTPSRFLCDNLYEIAPKLTIYLFDTNGNVQMNQTVSLPSNNVQTSNNQIIITIQHSPNNNYCLSEILIEATLPDGTTVPFLDLVFDEDQPYMEQGVTYTITITVQYGQPTSVSVPAPTGACVGGTPPST